MAPAPSKPNFFKTLYYRCYDLGVLPFYDIFVLKITCTAAWKAPLDTILLPFFRTNFSDDHLDIGVGSGFFPATVLAELPPRDDQQLTLWDLSTTALQKTKARVEAAAPHVAVSTIEGDAMGAIKGLEEWGKFESISASLLLHCIPASAEQKTRAVAATARQLLSPTGVFFGATVLGDTKRNRTAPSAVVDWFPTVDVIFGTAGETRCACELNMFARGLMWFYNRSGIFTNWNDNPDAFVEALEDEFEEVDSWVIGRVLLFRARIPRAESVA